MRENRKKNEKTHQTRTQLQCQADLHLDKLQWKALFHFGRTKWPTAVAARIGRMVEQRQSKWFRSFQKYKPEAGRTMKIRSENFATDRIIINLKCGCLDIIYGAANLQPRNISPEAKIVTFLRPNRLVTSVKRKQLMTFEKRNRSISSSGLWLKHLIQVRVPPTAAKHAQSERRARSERIPIISQRSL